jgi:hypothetical protein
MSSVPPSPASSPQADLATPERVLQLARRAADIADRKLEAIHAVADQTRILALNATITASKAGDAGRAFSAVAGEVKALAGEVARISGEMEDELHEAFAGLRVVGERMAARVRGARLVDLALNAIELMDRNLYERTCDVRWWATDAAVVEAVRDPSPANLSHASRRLGVILSAYTVYLDLWICDPSGRVVAHGRPERYPAVGRYSAAGEKWFQEALASASGDEFAVSPIRRCEPLGQAPVATYAAAIRENGDRLGRVLGVIGVHFDWGPQARAIVSGIRLDEDERTRTRVLLLDAQGLVLASSDERGQLSETVTLPGGLGVSGCETGADGRLLAYHRTPGYETYRGLGWYGALLQNPRSETALA